MWVVRDNFSHAMFNQIDVAARQLILPNLYYQNLGPRIHRSVMSCEDELASVSVASLHSRHTCSYSNVVSNIRLAGIRTTDTKGPYQYERSENKGTSATLNSK